MLDLLQQEMIPSLRKGHEWAMHLEDGHHVVELTVQATEEHEDTICRSLIGLPNSAREVAMDSRWRQ
jgi:hypothetical protein